MFAYCYFAIRWLVVAAGLERGADPPHFAVDLSASDSLPELRSPWKSKCHRRRSHIACVLVCPAIM